MPRSNIYGLVICGGKSTRMGSDKSLLSYHNKPQCYYVYEMLEQLCGKVFISCNPQQVHQFSSACNIMPDMQQYENTGPMAALLTAFNHYQKQNFLIVGCDYPFITIAGLQLLLDAAKNNVPAAAFFNENEKLYEPLLAWYSNKAAVKLSSLFENGKRSLQHFLQENNAVRIIPPQQKMMISVDTPEAFEAIKKAINE